MGFLRCDTQERGPQKGHQFLEVHGNGVQREKTRRVTWRGETMDGQEVANGSKSWRECWVSGGQGLQQDCTV